MSSRGFSLVELLIACALLLAVTGALAAITLPVRDTVDRFHASSDVESNARNALTLLAGELRHAGLIELVAALDDNVAVSPARAVRLTTTPAQGARAHLRVPAAAGDTVIHLETALRCTSGPPICGFSPGMSAALIHGDSFELVEIISAAAGSIRLAEPISFALPMGTTISEVAHVAFGTRPTPAGALRLVRLSDGGAEQPLAEHVTAFTLTAEAEPDGTIQSVTANIRAQAASDAFRGPAGPLFTNGGRAIHARRWIPDFELTTTVAVRNALSTP